MKRRTGLAGIVLLLAAGVGTAVALRKPGTAEAPKRAPPAPIEFIADDLVTLAPRPLERTVALTGTVKAANQTIVKTKVAGDLVQLLVREGEAVKAGQVVARIDGTEYEWRVKREQAALAASQAQLDMAAKTRANNAQLLAKGFISQNAFDNAASGLDAARGNRDAAAAALEISRKALADTVLRAPMAGLVAERFAQQGEKLPVDGRVLSIVDLSSLEVEAPIPADDIAQVSIGNAAEFAIEGGTRRFTGKVVRINPATVAGSRSIFVYVRIDQPDPSLRAGVFVNGRLLLARGAPVLALPVTAVREDGGAARVLAVVDGKLAQVPVQLGARSGDAAEIKSGLPAGVQVVRSFDTRLAVGAPVRIATTTGANRNGAMSAR
jgi:RND family efflux transporter MFP subunit